MYKTCNVHLVQTKEKAKIGELTTNATDPKALFIMSKEVYDAWEAMFLLTDEKVGGKHLRGNHLIITSDDKLSIGDLMFNTEDEHILICESLRYLNTGRWKKIIAATKSLNKSLPKLPENWIEHFIREYESSNRITNVQVEYDYCGIHDKNVLGREEVTMTDENIVIMGFKLKTTGDNNEIIINIEPVKPIFYTEQEVREFFELYRKYLDDFPTVRTTKKKLDVWFENNKLRR